MSITASHLPRWTRRVAMDGSGRDPLGLSRVSDKFTAFLLPSITTITPRARYFSFYSWAVAQCQEALKNGGEQAFEERFRCLDTAFAIGSRYGKTTELNITGIEKVNARLPDPSSNVPVDLLFQVLPSSKFGAFGQAYGSPIENLGMIRRREDGGWELRPGRGESLASSFANAVETTDYRKSGWTGEQFVSPKALYDSRWLFSLDGIRDDAAYAEREILTRIFFDLDRTEDTLPQSHRQATLGLLIHVFAAYDKAGCSPTRRNIDDEALFWPHYYESLYIEGEDSIPYEAHPALEETRQYWRQFCLHQLFLYATEEFFQAMLEAMATEADGVNREEMVDRMLEAGFVDDINRATGSDHSGPAALLLFFGADGPSGDVRKLFSCDHHLSEWWVYFQDYDAEEPGGPVTRLGRAFSIWCLLYAKWRGSEGGALLKVAGQADGEWWAGTSFEWGDGWRKDAPEWREALLGLVDVFVGRHEQVRFQKGKLDASWFEILGGRFLRIQDLVPDFRGSRHQQVATVFQDLCLFEDGDVDDQLKLTEQGKEILKEVIQARS